MKQYIESVKPRHWYQHYSQKDSQGTLIRQTKEWPNGCILHKVEVPENLQIDSAYIDRMYDWNRDKMELVTKHLSKWMDSPDDELIKFVSKYFDVECVAVRTVFYFDVSSGHPCPRVDFLYKKSIS